MLTNGDLQAIKKIVKAEVKPVAKRLGNVEGGVGSSKKAAGHGRTQSRIGE